MTTIMGVRIADREKDAETVQNMLTEYGCYIKTRLGLHEAVNSCSSSGIIILEFVADSDEHSRELMGKLQAIESVTVKTMIF